MVKSELHVKGMVKANRQRSRHLGLATHSLSHPHLGLATRSPKGMVKANSQRSQHLGLATRSQRSQHLGLATHSPNLHTTNVCWLADKVNVYRQVAMGEAMVKVSPLSNRHLGLETSRLLHLHLGLASESLSRSRLDLAMVYLQTARWSGQQAIHVQACIIYEQTCN